MAFKEVIFNSSTLGGCGGVEKNCFVTASILGRYGGLERTDVLQLLL